MFMRRCQLAYLVILVVSCLPESGRAAEDEKEKRFEEGWQKQVPVFPYDRESGTYLLKVDDGWLHVIRKTAADVTEWHVVLAMVDGSDPPWISATPALFQVSYGQRYFLRESHDILRCVRQPKEGIAGTFSLLDVQREQQGIQKGGGASRLAYQQDGAMRTRVFAVELVGDDWIYAAAGPEQDRMDCLVRLMPAGLAGSHGSKGGGGHLMISVDGMRTDEMWLLDDGEMLIVRRILDSEAN